MASDDPFHQDSGLKDDYDGVIVDAWFATDPAYNNGQSLLLFVKKLADDGEETEDRYSCGDGWSSYDGGMTAEHGTKVFYNNQSAIGQLVQRAFTAGAEAVMRERSAAGAVDPKSGMPLGPRSADLWKNLKFHWIIETQDRTIRGEKVTTNRSFPDKYLGVVDGAVGGSAGGSAASADEGAATQAGTPAPAADQSSNPLDTVSPEVGAQIKVLAKTLDYAPWVDEAMTLTGVVESGTLLAALGDKSFYDTLRG